MLRRYKILMSTKESIIESIGTTPLVAVTKMNAGKSDVFAKLEYFNPTGSVKDRAALYMILDAERKGLLKKGSTIIEPTSGNTGIGLAMICAEKSYKLILTMPDTMSLERRKLLSVYGAELVLTEGAKGMNGAIARAKELAAEIPDSFIPNQFENAANAQAHYETTAPEIWADTDGQVDILIAGVGTGGTISGIGKFLKEKNPAIKIIAVEPSDSPVLSGGKPGPHKIQGIGAGFVPKIYNASVVDEIIQVSSENAGKTARELAKKEGMLVGISSGAAMFAALEKSKLPENVGKKIVVILPDGGSRYLSTWLFE